MIDRRDESRVQHRPRRLGARLVVRVSVGPETSDQVVLANGAKFAQLHVRTVRGSEIELLGSTYFPRQCQLRIELAATPSTGAENAGAPSKRLNGVVRRSQTISPEPLHSIWVQVSGSDSSLLSEIQAALVAGREAVKEPVAVDGPDQAASNDEAPGEESLVSRAIDLGVPFVDPRIFDIQFANGALLPEELVRRHRLFPLFHLSGAITLGMQDPSDLAAVDHVRLRTGFQVEACLCSAEALDALIARAYHAPATGPSFDDSAHVEMAKSGDPSGHASNTIVQLVRALLEESARDGASDIHIEPERDFTRVRLRVDGILHEKSTQPSERHAAIVSRIKVMSKLDISEVRRPQDGHFSLTLQQRNLDVRVSTIPTIHGENVVLRLLLSGGKAVELDELGMPAWALKKMEGLLEHPNGLILVAGPTGSGKTTTLYAALARLNTIDRNVVTVEDPVERRMTLLRQTQVNPKAGVTFASGLRSILRQDPDVIMVGEIRDRETAEIAVQAALTGHLVLSTLHTTTAAGAIVRLSEMGIPPFLITSSLRAVISQRLTRRICSECCEPVVPDARLVAGLGFKSGEKVNFMAGAGCARCLQTGYKGRVGIYEMLQITPALGRALLGGGSRDEIEKEGNRALSCGLREDGLQKIRDGLTTVEEIARIVGLEQVDASAESGA